MSDMYNKPRGRLTLREIVDPSQTKEQVIFRPTQVHSGDVNMKRYNQGPPDLSLNHIAGKGR
ncbi:hypothetical protein KUTeg_018251 [Tegillarca granosa]|uniref:Uncharacterized protein n=1 Tax=Tegillarca granosa TaxID=220873 RepID=A0ABQ9EHB3_TEGGR|nr:hypothetical protein KUTeg_018251 [Tegillarca granosa]